MKKEYIGYLILGALGIVAIIVLIFSPPIVQNATYHNFSDANTIFNIPNFWNVISNIPFLIVGLLGLWHLNTITNEKKSQCFLFFLGVSLVSIGSGYYHFNPNNNSLIWDRLPMTIAFMALFSIVISEFVNFKIGQLLLIPAILIGLLSIVYWLLYDDLRVYVLVQFYPMLAIPIILIFFKSSYNLTIGYWLLLVAYIMAKFLEHYDYQTYQLLKVISGHTLKHVFAAVGIYILLYTYLKRRKNLPIQ